MKFQKKFILANGLGKKVIEGLMRLTKNPLNKKSQ